MTRTTSGWTAGIVAFVLVGAACSSGTSPEAGAPTTVSAQADEPATEPTDEPTTEQTAESSDAPAASVVEPVEDPPDTTPPTSPAPEALQFTAPLVGGGEIDLAAGFDDKPTVFWFWAPT
jgi:hypothetical protein